MGECSALSPSHHLPKNLIQVKTGDQGPGGIEIQDRLGHNGAGDGDPVVWRTSH